MKKYLLLSIISITVALYSATVDESIQQAKTKYASGNAQAAISILDSAIAVNPDNSQAKKMLADICVDTGEREYAVKNYKNAYDYFKKAVKSYPTHAIATERYWKMKTDFDVATLRNEGGVTPEKTSDEKPEKDKTEKEKPADGKNKTVVSDKETEDLKPLRDIKERKKAIDPVMADDIYTRRINQMEERYNKRLKDITAQSKTDENNKKGFINRIVDDTSLTIAASFVVVLVVIFLIIAVYFANVFIKKKLLYLKGRKEHEKLFNGKDSSAYYNELIKMQNVNELISKIKSGDLDWNTIKKSIGELDKELRLEVLSVIENKIERERQPLTVGQADVLMALLLDGNDYLKKRVSSTLSMRIGYNANIGNDSDLQALPDYSDASGNGQEVLQLADQRDSAVESSMIEDLNIVLPLSKIVDRKVFNDNHAVRVGVDAFYMSGLLGLSSEERNLYYIAGLVHDIGYLDVPSEVLNKRTSLSEKDFELIKTHTHKGLELLDFTVIPQIVKDGILYHHERWAGDGYNEGLAGDKIPLVARVISIFDMYEALILPRPQRPAFSTKEAVRIIKKGSGVMFDPVIVKHFEAMVKDKLVSREDIWKK